MFAGTVAAKPNWIEELTLNYGYDGLTFPNPVEGALAPGFTLYYDEAVAYYYLDVNSIDPPPSSGDYDFYLQVASPTKGFFEYWESRGVYEGCSGTWEPYMWQIITAQEPMFILQSDGTQCDLIDGLQYLASSGVVEAPLRINGDYFVGTYQFTGDVDGAKTTIKLTFATLPKLFHDLQMWGYIVVDGDVTTEEKGKMQYGTYMAKSINPYTTIEWFAFFWNGVPMHGAKTLMGTASFEFEYKINTDTKMGTLRAWCVYTVPGGTFEGEMLCVGELSLNADDSITIVKVMVTGTYHGTGAYEGWKITQNQNGRPSWSNPALNMLAGSNHLLIP